MSATATAGDPAPAGPAPVKPAPGELPLGSPARGSPARFIIPMLVIAALAYGGWWWTHRPDPNGPLALQGNVEVRQVNLSFKVAGRIANVAVDEGDQVASGQTLATLDPVYFTDAIAQVRAQRDQAQATLAKAVAGNRPEDIAQADALVTERQSAVTNAKITFDRAQRLLQTAAGSQKVFDDGQAALRQTEAQLNSARAAAKLMKIGSRQEDIDAARGQLAEREATLAIAQRQLDDATLQAPGPGVVLSRVRENGAIVSAGEAVYVVSLTNPVWVRTYVSELELGRVKPGAAVDITTDAPGTKALHGRIGFISPTAEFTPKTVETRELRTALVYRIRVVVDADPDGTLRQGMPVTVTLSGSQLAPGPVATNSGSQ